MSLRSKQNMEILDVFSNIRSQLVGLQKRQVADTGLPLKPMTQRDLSVEVNVEKVIESMNRALEGRLGSLEFFVQNINTNNSATVNLTTNINKLPFTQSFQNITGVGELNQLWNSIVRYYKSPGLSRQSQEQIKVKIQELKPNLDAIKYGLNSGIQTIFAEKITGPAHPEISLKILELLRAASFYSLVDRQVGTGSLEIINNEVLQSEYKNMFDSLTSEQIGILQAYAPRGDVTKTPLRNIPLVNNGRDRVLQVANELGLNPNSGAVQMLMRLPLKELESVINKHKAEIHSGEKHTENEKIQNEVEGILNSIKENEMLIVGLRRRISDLNDLKTDAESKEDIKEVDVDDLKEPIQPRFEIADPDGYEEKYQAYYDEVENDLENVKNEEHNKIARMNMEDLLSQSKMIDERIRAKKDELEEALEQQQDFRLELSSLAERVETNRNLISAEVYRNVVRILEPLIRKTKYRDVGDEKIEGRGRASMRRNYYSNSSDSESDEGGEFMNFDDKRNDCYTKR